MKHFLIRCSQYVLVHTPGLQSVQTVYNNSEAAQVGAYEGFPVGRGEVNIPFPE